MKEFKRIYFKLDKKNNIAEIITVASYKIEGDDPNETWDKLVNILNKVEGEENLINNKEKNIDDLWDGVYKTKEIELPIIGFMERMQLKGDIFNFLYYTFDGNSNKDLINYLYLNGVRYKIKKDL